MPRTIDARDRLIAAALRVAYAERGGLDHANSAAELELAHEMLDEAVGGYFQATVQAMSGLPDEPGDGQTDQD